MSVFHVFKIVQMLPNRVMHHICSANQLTESYMRGATRSLMGYIITEGLLTYTCIKQSKFLQQSLWKDTIFSYINVPLHPKWVALIDTL